MQQGIQHHVQDEEQKIFPQCTEFMNDSQLDQIAQQCISEKEKSRPSQAAAGKGAQRSSRKNRPSGRDFRMHGKKAPPLKKRSALFMVLLAVPPATTSTYTSPLQEGHEIFHAHPVFILPINMGYSL